MKTYTWLQSEAGSPSERIASEKLPVVALVNVELTYVRVLLPKLAKDILYAVMLTERFKKPVVFVVASINELFMTVPWRTKAPAEHAKSPSPSPLTHEVFKKSTATITKTADTNRVAGELMKLPNFLNLPIKRLNTFYTAN